MSGEDDDSDKSFEPTEQKLRKAREKGRKLPSPPICLWQLPTWGLLWPFMRRVALVWRGWELR